MGSRDDVFLDIAHALAPGKYDAVALIQAYFDESYSDEHGILCLAGYVFVKSKLKKFDAGWRLMLANYSLPYFRMSSCAHGNKAFKRLSSAQRLEVEMRAIALIKRHASVGISSVIDFKNFEGNLQENDFVTSAYEHCVWVCLKGVQQWADKNCPLGSIAYFFEAGDKH